MHAPPGPPSADPTPALADAFSSAGKALYLVGGSVRDLLLGRPSPDLDFTTDARPRQVKTLLRRAGADSIFAVGEKFGTIGAWFGDCLVEVTTYRSERYQPGSRKPDVEFGHSLYGDLSRRDFTVNAIAQDVRSGELVDPFGGQADLKARLIRAVGCAAERFAEDPLRLLRAVRLAVQLGLDIEPATRQAIVEEADRLAEISRERIAQEMHKLLLAGPPTRGIRLLCDLGLMREIIPELLAMRGMLEDRYRHKDVFEHTLQVVDRSPPVLAVRWAALLHDIAKPRTRSVENGQVHFFGHERVGEQMAARILAGLHLDRRTIERVCTLVRMHQRANSYDEDWTDGAVRRFMREAGPALEDLLVLSRADVTTRRPEKMRAAARRVTALETRVAEIRAREDVERLSSPLDGHELMALFGRGPGPWIKPIKDRLLSAVLDGTLAPDDKEGAAAVARETLADLEGQAT
ncbi:MAG TPA: HD domain-containing protein [Chloroflexota bacterium]|nr:HD domain-containing protein [Chloroflexota bacterium]